MFKDITPVLQHPAAFAEAIDGLVALARQQQPDVIVGIESRGFIFGVPIAMSLGLPFVLTRKLGKLPYERVTEEWDVELKAAGFTQYEGAVTITISLTLPIIGTQTDTVRCDLELSRIH